tara:strand:- start:367 stop:1359 length:993 start_codon:yes stop_codon:yes gene_type:complete
MNVIVLGTTNFSLKAAEGFLDNGYHISALINMPENVRPQNSANVKEYASYRKIAYYEIEDVNSQASIDILSSQSPDLIFLSWPKIIQSQVIQVPKYCCIGTHPTNLPFNRGRHPLHWLITQGIPETKLSFFVVDEGVDTGDILLQQSINIKENDTISDVSNRIDEAVYEGVSGLVDTLNEFESGYEADKNTKINDYCKVQDPKLANYWRKKTPFDVTLDFRLSTQDLIRIVRSFTLPFPCANLIFEDYIIKVIEAYEGNYTNYNLSVPINYIEPGKIIQVKSNHIIVKTNDGFVELVCRDKLPKKLKSAKYIHPPIKYLSAIEKLHKEFL